MTIAAPTAPSERQVREAALARSRLYQLLSGAFAFPDQALHRRIRQGRWPNDLAAASTGLPYRLPFRLPRRWTAPADYDRFQSEYIRLFEVGPTGAPAAPLHSGHYTHDRLRTVEELLRFYHFFGLRQSPGHMPDHLTVELEFMHFLALSEAEAPEPRWAHPFRRAQRDFLRRHLLSWTPAFTALLFRRRPPSFYRALASLAARFLEADARYLDTALASPQGESWLRLS